MKKPSSSSVAAAPERPAKEFDLNSYGQGRCHICDIGLTSQRHAAEHLSGRKHIQNKTVWEKASSASSSKTGA